VKVAPSGQSPVRENLIFYRQKGALAFLPYFTPLVLQMRLSPRFIN
jgi:hypothetical protein